MGDYTDEAGRQKHLLSRAQVNVVVQHINDKIDIWGLSEEVERRLIKQPVKKVNRHMKECLRSIMNEDWSEVVEALLDESMLMDDKTTALRGVFKRQLRDPLAAALADKMDIPIM